MANEILAYILAILSVIAGAGLLLFFPSGGGYNLGLLLFFGGIFFLVILGYISFLNIHGEGQTRGKDQ